MRKGPGTRTALVGDKTEATRILAVTPTSSKVAESGIIITQDGICIIHSFLPSARSILGSHHPGRNTT
jgi:hypothetical protein